MLAHGWRDGCPREVAREQKLILITWKRAHVSDLTNHSGWSGCLSVLYRNGDVFDWSKPPGGAVRYTPYTPPGDDRVKKEQKAKNWRFLWYANKLIWGFTLMPSGQIPRNFTFFFENMSRQRLNLLARHSRRLVSYGWEKAPDNTSLHGRRVLLSQFVLSFTWLLLRVPKRYILVQTALNNTWGFLVE